jgi:hypothetical protein
MGIGSQSYPETMSWRIDADLHTVLTSNSQICVSQAYFFTSLTDEHLQVLSDIIVERCRDLEEFIFTTHKSKAYGVFQLGR